MVRFSFVAAAIVALAPAVFMPSLVSADTIGQKRVLRSGKGKGKGGNCSSGKGKVSRIMPWLLVRNLKGKERSPCLFVYVRSPPSPYVHNRDARRLARIQASSLTKTSFRGLRTMPSPKAGGVIWHRSTPTRSSKLLSPPLALARQRLVELMPGSVVLPPVV